MWATPCRTPSKASCKGGRRAFSLLELLICLAIFLIVLIPVTNLYLSSHRVGHAARKLVDATLHAQNLLDLASSIDWSGPEQTTTEKTGASALSKSFYDEDDEVVRSQNPGPDKPKPHGARPHCTLSVPQGDEMVLLDERPNQSDAGSGELATLLTKNPVPFAGLSRKVVVKPISTDEAVLSVEVSWQDDPKQPSTGRRVALQKLVALDN